MECLVMVSSWEQQCCGEPFGLGSTVRWGVTASEGWAGQLLGDDWTERIQFDEGHHGLGTDGELTGVVTELQVLTSALRPSTTGHSGRAGQAFEHVPGSGRLRRVDSFDLWEPEPAGMDLSWQFVGWLVTLHDAVYVAAGQTAV